MEITVTVICTILLLAALFGLSAHRIAQANKLHNETVAFLAEHGISLSNIEGSIEALVVKAKSALSGAEADAATSAIAAAKADLSEALKKAEAAMGLGGTAAPATVFGQPASAFTPGAPPVA